MWPGGDSENHNTSLLRPLTPPVCFLLFDRCDDVYLAVRVEGNAECDNDERVKTDSYITLSQPGFEHQDRLPEDLDSFSVREIDTLKAQLREAEETAQRVQREVTSEWLQTKLPLTL